MAAFTRGFQVPAREGELGAGVMVEVPCQPRPGVVTAVALLAELCLVFVRLGMARHTVLGCVLELGRLMTTLARHIDVTPGQRKCGKVVIENRGAPFSVAVATFAPSTQLPLMLIVLFVTAVAVQGRVAIACRRGVTRCAFHRERGMTIAQGESCDLVLEAKVCALPGPFAVAGGAVSTQGGFVCIVFGVAA